MSQFTDKFQKQLLYILCQDSEYMRNYGDLLSLDYFDSNECKILFQIIREYVAAYDTDLDQDMLVMQVNDYCQRNNVEESFYKTYRTLADEIFELGAGLESPENIKDITLHFVQRQEVKKAIIQSIDILSNDGDFHQIAPLIENAVSIGESQDKGLSIQDLGNLKELYRATRNSASLIRTGIPDYDKVLSGGMAPGELHCLCAAPKGGKSTFGCCIGAFNIRQKKNVFHITLELKELDIMVKYALILGHISYPEFFTMSDEEYQYKLRKFLKARDNLFIKYWTGSTINVGHIRSYINKICSEKRRIDPSFKPHLIIVDYDDYLLPIKQGDSSDYNNAGYVYDDLIKMADYFKCPIFTFSQTVRASWDAYEKEGNLITSGDVAHSAKRIHKCYSFSSLNFKKKAEHGVLYVDMNRKGPGGKLIPLKRDLSRAFFGQDLESPEIDDD